MKTTINKLQQLPRLILTITLFSILAACGGGGGSGGSTAPTVSTDASLSNLALSADSLNPTFASDVTAYTVSTKAISTTVTPTVSNAKSTVTVNGTATNSGSASVPIDLTVGDNVITLIVTAEDATTKTYSITVTRIALSTDADLSGLALSTGSLNTAFASDVTAYTLSTKAISTTVTPTVSDANATVTVNGTTTNSGSASVPIDLTVGDNVITLIVTAEDATTKTYSITVTRIALSTDADLSNLALSTGSLNTAFASDVTAYTVSTKVEAITVTPTVSNAKSTVTVNGTATNSGSASVPIDLTVGDNLITLIVTAEDATTKTYSITVTRIALSTDADLSGLALSTGSLNTAFASDVTAYTLSTKAISTTVTPTVSDANATVTVNGTTTNSGSASVPIDLTVGDNVITLIVTAEDATTKTYSITVTRIALSTDADLSGLALSTGSLNTAFASDVTAYTVSTKVEAITVTPTVSDANATVTVNGTAADTGIASAPIDLTVGDNVITLIVTAEDASTKTYSITVTRIALSTDADLSNLALSTGSLNTAFASDVTAYTVSTKAEAITVTPTVSDGTYATVTVNSTATDSGKASVSINLAVGDNTINVIVTAEDASTKTYSITVTRIALSTDTNLSSIMLSANNYSSTPGEDYLHYLETKASSTTVTPTVRNAYATVTVDGIKVQSGSTSKSIDLNFGSDGRTNVINVVVTAEDGSTATYEFLVRRIPNVDLSNLELSAGSLDSPFASDTTDYTVTTIAETITVTPTVSDDSSTVTVNGNSTDSGSASASIDLDFGENTITLIVTAGEGSTQTYTITVTRIPLATDANLSRLVLSVGSFSPTFDSNVTAYTLRSTNAESATVTPTLSDVKASVTVDGIEVNSGSASAITLTVGENTISVVVTAEDSSIKKTYTITVTRVVDLELINPDAAANQKFGQKIVQLGNGNIIVHAPGYGTDKGAVHFYKSTSGTAIASFYGTNAGDNLGSGGIIALANNNFLIVSPLEDKGELDAVGSVRLVNGTNGNIISTITGDNANDKLASKGITLLNSNEFIITSPNYQVDNIAVGSVLMVNNQGGISQTLYGSLFNVTNLGDKGVTALIDGRFVIVSTNYTHRNQPNSGLVLLMNHHGAVLRQITGKGEKPDENFGGDGIIPMKDDDFLILTKTHDVNGLTNAGSIYFVFGGGVDGDKKDGYLGKISGGDAATTTIKTLENNNLVLMHHTADNGSITNAGSIRLLRADDATQVGATVRGQVTDDFKNQSGSTKIITLANNNYVISAPFSDTKADTTTGPDIGSIRLMNGNTGAQLSIKYGDNDNDRLGSGDVIELSNQKYVVASPFHNSNNGSVTLFNGEGVVGGKLMAGNQGYLGSNGLTALGNNKFVIASQYDRGENSNIIDAGSIRLADADVVDENGNIKEIVAIHGDENDKFGNGGVTPLSNHNFVFAAPLDDVNGITNAGSVQVVDGTTGAPGKKIAGLKTGDMDLVQMIKPVTGDYFILSQPLADDNGSDSGKVRLVIPTF